MCITIKFSWKIGKFTCLLTERKSLSVSVAPPEKEENSIPREREKNRKIRQNVHTISIQIYFSADNQQHKRRSIFLVLLTALNRPRVVFSVLFIM